MVQKRIPINQYSHRAYFVRLFYERRHREILQRCRKTCMHILIFCHEHYVYKSCVLPIRLGKRAVATRRVYNMYMRKARCLRACRAWVVVGPRVNDKIKIKTHTQTHLNKHEWKTKLQSAAFFMCRSR